MYHKIGDHPRKSRLKSLWVTADDFRRQLKYLKARGYTAIGFSDLFAADEGGRPLPAKPVLITFDDGYANNFEIAFPILNEIGMKGNIFLSYEMMGRHNAWHDPASEPWIRMLTWDEIRRMQDSRMMEFGSHTMRHRNLGAIPIEDASWELEASKKCLEDKLGVPVTCFAYPYGAGAYQPEIRRLARKAGYRYDFGIKQGISPWPWNPDSGPFKRLFIRGDDFMLDFHLNLTRGRARL